MKNKKKILLILSTPPPYGGGEAKSELLFNFFKDKKNYYCIDIGFKKYTKKNQGKMNLLNLFHGVYYIVNVFFYVIYFRPAIVFANLAKDFPAFLKPSYIVIISKLLNIKVIGDLPGHTFYFLDSNGFKKRFGLFILRKIDLIRIEGKKTKEILSHFGLNRTKLMYNGVKVNAIPDVQRFNKLDKNIKLLYVGALSQAKGVDYLINGFNLLIEKYNNIELHLIGQWGENNFKNKVLNTITDYKNKFYFYGLQIGPQKWEIFNNCHIYVHFSQMEGQSISIIEALAMGMPVVATDAGATSLIIEDGYNGFIIEKKNIDQFVLKVSTLLNDHELIRIMSQRNIKKYRKRFTDDIFCQSMMNLFNSYVA